MADYIEIDGHKLDDVEDASKTQGTPTLSDMLLALTIGEDGKLSSLKHYTINTLISTLGKVATDAEAGAVEAKTAIEQMQSAITEAIENFNSKITSDNEAWDSKVEDNNSSWESQVAEDLQSLQTALTNALAAIGRTDSEGARKASLDAIVLALQGAIEDISQARSGALGAIGETDSEGARGAAISAIATALQEALEAWESQVNADNQTFDNKVTSAEQTIDEKVSQAGSSADDAAAAKNLAERYANAPKDEIVETINGVNKFSSRHYMEIAEQIANSPLASETAAGRSRITSNPDYSRPADNADPVAVSIEALQTAKTALQGSIGDEASARKSGDSNLANQISQLGVTVTNINSNLGNETVNRQNGDSNLQTQINTEVSNRQNADAQLQTQINERRIPPGMMLWYTGLIANVPAGYLVCNGQAVSRATYAALFAVLGTKYGAGDGSTTFNVPNLTDGNGRFIRAGFSDDVIGTKQADAIRNITARLHYVMSDFDTPETSPFYTASASSTAGVTFNGYNRRDNVGAFNLSRAVNTDSENRPYSFVALPLIAY